MIRFRAWGLSAALVAGAGAPALAADPPTATRPPVRQQTTVFNKLFGPSRSKTPPKPGPVAGTQPPTVTAPLPEDVQREAFRAEYDAYLRRLDVCTELRRVAVERNDEALQRQVDELERQAAGLYNQRVAALGVPRVKAPLPMPSASRAGLTTPEPVTARAAADRLTAPAAPTPVVGATAALKPDRLSPDSGIRTVGDSTPTISPAAPPGDSASNPTPVREGKP